MSLDATTELALDQITWKAEGSEDDPRARLHARLMIGSLRMHLTAVAVHEDEDGELVADLDPGDDELSELRDFAGGKFTTLTMNDREYVLYALPHCQ